MSATWSYELALSRCTTEQEWDGFINNDRRWRLIVEEEEQPLGTDFRITSRFGEVRSAVMMTPDRRPILDRPVYKETPFTQVVLWAKGTDNKIYFGMVEQERPHADEPGAENYGVNGHLPVQFLHVVMGFNEKSATGKFETDKQAAARESGEEAGVHESAIIGVEIHPFGHNPSPSFTSTWGSVVSIQVDLGRIGQPIPNPQEPINGVFFIEAHKLLEMIAVGQSDTGAYTGVSTSLSALMIHFASHPEHFPR